MMSMTNANGCSVELRRISKDYKFGKSIISALKDVDLKIAENDFVCIAGPSGSGKSTLFNILGCLDTPTNGNLFIDNELIVQNLSKEKIQLRRKKIGFIFQSYNLFPVMNVYENVEYPLSLLKISKKEKKELVNNALEEVGLYDRKHHYPDELSGGECQRVAIARALVKSPKLVLADEPTANLDTATGMKIVELMKKCNQIDKITFLFATHDSRLMQVADKVVYLRDGKVGESQ